MSNRYVVVSQTEYLTSPSTSSKTYQSRSQKEAKQNSVETKYGIIVAVATACATMATRWVCREFNAELCGSVETVAQRGIGSQNRLAMVLGRHCCHSDGLCPRGNPLGEWIIRH